MDNFNLLKVLDEKVHFGELLIQKLKTIQNIEGVTKLQRKILQEITYLKKLQNSQKVKEEQLSCSNLRHLGVLVECALRPGVVAVCKIFHIHDNSKLVVDVISNQGKTWTKVIARNPKSLSAISSGNASFGARSILDQAEDYIECAKLYPCMFSCPKVIFEFFSGIEETLANKLKSGGVTVKGKILPDSSHVEEFENSCESEFSNDNSSPLNWDKPFEHFNQCLEESSEITLLNLDVTAMMAYVSNMTNGYCNYRFQQHVLTQQAQWESERPVKPILEKLFKDKSLVCCQIAWDEFEKIINILGGPLEKDRTVELRKMLKVYPNDFGGEDDYPKKNLKVKGHVRLRSKIVFNFGHRIKALTVSANESFIRAAQQQGVTYAAFIHESRALTEGKQATGTKITESS